MEVSLRAELEAISIDFRLGRRKAIAACLEMLPNVVGLSVNEFEDQVIAGRIRREIHGMAPIAIGGWGGVMARECTRVQLSRPRMGRGKVGRIDQYKNPLLDLAVVVNSYQA